MEVGSRIRHNHKRVLMGLALLPLVLGLAGVGHTAEPLTPLSSRKNLHHLKKFYRVAGFKLGGVYDFGRESAYALGGRGGVTLESLGQGPLRLAYITVGKARRDRKGFITNAVLINSYYSGDATDMYFFWCEGQAGVEFSGGPIVGPGRLIDTNKYFVIFVDSIGMWGASKPSDGLGLDFPRYSYMDIVQANYRLLKDKLRVKKMKFATGVSMGGALCYVWAILHPNFVEAIIPIGANSSPDNVARWIFTLMNEAVKSDPVWRKTQGRYYHLPKSQHPRQGQMFAWSILELTAHDFRYRVQEDWEEEVKPYVFKWKPKGREGLNLRRRKNFDANDIIVRNRTCLSYDINAQLPRIKARTLIIHATNDQWVIFNIVKKTARLIPGATLAAYKHPLAHYSIFRAPHLVQKQLLAFYARAGIKTGVGRSKPAFRKAFEFSK